MINLKKTLAAVLHLLEVTAVLRSAHINQMYNIRMLGKVLFSLPVDANVS